MNTSRDANKWLIDATEVITDIRHHTEHGVSTHFFAFTILTLQPEHLSVCGERVQSLCSKTLSAGEVKSCDHSVVRLQPFTLGFFF